MTASKDGSTRRPHPARHPLHPRRLLGKIGGFAGTAGYIASKGLPLPEVGAALAIAVEILAGIALVVGWKTRWAALLLAVFTLVATFFFHASGRCRPSSR